MLQAPPIANIGALPGVSALDRVAGLDVPFDHAGTEEETEGVGSLVRGIGDLTVVRAAAGSVGEETQGNADRDRGSLRVGGPKDSVVRRAGGGAAVGDTKTGAVPRRRVGFASLRTFDKTNQVGKEDIPLKPVSGGHRS